MQASSGQRSVERLLVINSHAAVVAYAWVCATGLTKALTKRLAFALLFSPPPLHDNVHATLLYCSRADTGQRASAEGILAVLSSTMRFVGLVACALGLRSSTRLAL